MGKVERHKWWTPHTSKAAELFIVEGVQVQKLLQRRHYLQRGRLQVVLTRVVRLISQMLYSHLQGAVVYLHITSRPQEHACCFPAVSIVSNSIDAFKLPASSPSCTATGARLLCCKALSVCHFRTSLQAVLSWQLHTLVMQVHFTLRPPGSMVVTARKEGRGPHRVEPSQAAVAQEQQLRLAALQLRDVVHLAEGPRLMDV